MIHVALDHALTDFRTTMSPWRFPQEWTDAETNHVGLIVQALLTRMGSPEVEMMNFSGSMVYQVRSTLVSR